MSEKYYSASETVLSTKNRIILFLIFVSSIISVFAGFFIYTKIIYKQEVDLFEYVDVKVEGVSDEASAQVYFTVNDDDLTNSISYNLSKSTNISNGEVLTLTAVPDEDFMKSKRYFAKVFTKQFPVQGLSFIAKNKNEVPLNSLKQIVSANNEKVKDIFSSEISNATSVEVKNLSYYYKKGDNPSDDLSVYFISQINYTERYFFNTINIPSVRYYINGYDSFLINNSGEIEKYSDSNDLGNSFYYLPNVVKQVLLNNGYTEWEV